MPFVHDHRRAVRTAWLVAIGLLAAGSPAWAQRAVFVVRHAERADQSRDSGLSAAGQARSAALARHLRDAGVTAAFVTDLQRTQQTAAPLAEMLGLKPVAMPAAPTQAMVERIRRDHAEGVVLVVGHSNTVPEVLELFGHAEPVTIRDDEYDALFVLMPRPGAPPGVVRLRYRPLLAIGFGSRQERLYRKSTAGALAAG